MGRSVVVIGGPDGGAAVSESIRRIGAATGALVLAGFLNDRLAPGTDVGGVPVLGAFDAWGQQGADTLFVSALHKAKVMAARARRIERLQVPRDRWATVVDPAAMLAHDVQVGVDCCVSQFATVMQRVRIGDHVAVRDGVHLGHDTVLESFVFVGANAVVNGRSRIGAGAHIGPGAVLREDVSVGTYAVVGLGAVVLESVPDRAVVVGNPAHVIAEVPRAEDGEASGTSGTG